MSQPVTSATGPQLILNSPVPERSVNWVQLAANQTIRGLAPQEPQAPPEIPPPGAQQSMLALSLHIVLTKTSPTEPVTIFASLENSLISAGPMIHDTGDQRGYFQDKIVVEMWIGGMTTTPSTVFTRVSDAPMTVNGSGSTSSSISTGTSTGGNLGAFGFTGTAGGELSVSQSTSNSFSRNLTDFKVINTSDSHRAVHTYQLAETAEGHPYTQGSDLLPPALGIGDIGAPFQLFSPPDLATANLELISQCLWQANTSEPIKTPVTLRIRVTQQAVTVSGARSGLLGLTGNASRLSAVYLHTEPLPLQLLGEEDDTEIIPPGPPGASLAAPHPGGATAMPVVQQGSDLFNRLRAGVAGDPNQTLAQEIADAKKRVPPPTPAGSTG